MATQNSIDNKTQNLTIDPGASGDSFIQFDLNTVSEFRIGVDDTDDSFRISQGSALGTTDTFVMTAAGERTLPLQSAFSAYLSTVQNNVIGTVTIYDYICDTEIFDQNGDYNTSTGIFTAPVTGRYFFSAGIAAVTTSNTDTINSIVETSNRTYKGGYSRNPSNAQAWYHIDAFTDMDAADTAFPGAQTVGEAGDTNNLLPSTASLMKTFFTGRLVC